MPPSLLHVPLCFPRTSLHFHSGLLGLLLLSPDIISFTLFFLCPSASLLACVSQEETWRGLASGLCCKPSLPVGEGSEKERGATASKTERYSDHYLILGCVCVCVSVCLCGCDYSRVCSESQGKCGSSVCVVLTWRYVCRLLTHTWRRPRVSFDNTSPWHSPLAECENSTHTHNTCLNTARIRLQKHFIQSHTNMNRSSLSTKRFYFTTYMLFETYTSRHLIWKPMG